MAKYIKNKDGKFAGSIGDGKTKTPSQVSIFPVDALMKAFTNNPTGTVKLSEVAESYHEQQARIISSGRGTFGAHASSGETTLANDPQQWADDLANVVENTRPEEFRNDFVANSVQYDNGTDERHFTIHDGDTSDAWIVYSRDEDAAWVETWTQQGGPARSDVLADRYRDALRD